MKTLNLSNPGVEPIDGDLIRIEYDSGATETKYHCASAAPDKSPSPAPWTKKEFLLKFTPTEYAAIAAATKTNAALDYYWQLFMVAENVLKTDPATIAGINALEGAGLLAAGRAAEILA